MPYVMRDDTGSIIGITDSPAAQDAEWLAETDAEMVEYTRREEEIIQAAKTALEGSDVEMVRVIEDLIGVMIDKGVIRYTDLPEAARHKIDSRIRMRRSLNSVDNPMVGEHDIL